MDKIITISGLPGSGSTTAAKLLAKKLDCNYFSPGQLFKDIAAGKYKEQHYHAQFKKLCDERSIIIPELSSKNASEGTVDLWNSEFGKSAVLHKTIDDLQIELAKNGNIVLDGKLSLYMIKDAHIKIWLHASKEKRAKRSAERDKIDLEKARNLVEVRERKEREEWKKIYGFDSQEQEKLAHVVLDTSNLNPEEVIKEILSNAKCFLSG